MDFYIGLIFGFLVMKWALNFGDKRGWKFGKQVAFAGAMVMVGLIPLAALVSFVKRTLS